MTIKKKRAISVRAIPVFGIVCLSSAIVCILTAFFVSNRLGAAGWMGIHLRSMRTWHLNISIVFFAAGALLTLLGAVLSRRWKVTIAGGLLTVIIGGFYIYSFWFAFPDPKGLELHVLPAKKTFVSSLQWSDAGISDIPDAGEFVDSRTWFQHHEFCLRCKMGWFQVVDGEKDSIVTSRENEMRQEIERKALTSWIERHVDEVSADLDSYYCKESYEAGNQKKKPNTFSADLIITGRQMVKLVDVLTGDERRSRNEHQIRMTAISPKEIYGRRIYLSAWQDFPGPEPKWMMGADTGNLISLSLDKELLNPDAWLEPLKLSYSSIGKFEYRKMCVRPEVDD